MAQDDQVAVCGDDLDGVLQGLALGHGAELAGGLGAQRLTPKPEHGGLEAEAGAGARLVEEAGHDAALQLVATATANDPLHVLSRAEDPVKQGSVELLAFDHVSQLGGLLGRYGHKKISFPASQDRFKGAPWDHILTRRASAASA